MISGRTKFVSIEISSYPRRTDQLDGSDYLNKSVKM